MADDSTTSGEAQASAAHLTFNVKSSSDTKHVVTVPETMSVLELKQKLSTSEYADVPAERQRLIYSGRVLKDVDPLSNYKIKDGNTIHLVKSAASTQPQQQQQASSQSASSPSSNTPSAQSNPASGVPQNLAAGTGNDPLAGLTGARYAGFAQMPSASTFGADGGMNPAQNPEEFMQMLENPMFQSQMNEAMNNPDVIRMMQNMPQFRNNPMLRQMLENPEFRRMMTDPQFIRQSLQMSRLMGGGGGPFGGGAGGAGGMPAPGVTDTTPQQGATGAQEQQQTGAGGEGQQGQQQQQGGAAELGTGAAAGNPFGGLFGMGGMGGMGGTGGTGSGGGAAAGNPFAQLFGGAGGSPFANPNAPGSPTSNTDSNNAQNTANANTNTQQQQDPFGNLMGLMNMEALMRGQNQQNPNAQPPSWLQALNESMQQQQPPAPQDTRPPEEQYESQLRQLNDMGFFEFERNVRALRMSGGNVQGAIEYLLSDP